MKEYLVLIFDHFKFYGIECVFEFDKKLLYMKLKEIEVISAIETFNDCYNFE